MAHGLIAPRRMLSTLTRSNNLVGRVKTALVVDRKEDNAESLLDALQPEFIFDELDFASTILNAIDCFEGVQYAVCFLSDSFPLAELNAFFEDIGSMNRDLNCVFAQVRESIPAGFDRYSLQTIGIDIVISRAATQQDKAGLQEAITKKSNASEVKERITDMSQALDILLREVDRRAENKKRGRNKKDAGTEPTAFIAMQTNFDEQVMARYYQTLTRKTYIARPSLADTLEVPQQVLERQLPRLTRSGYDGASSRVWEKLQRNHGVKVTNQEKIKPDNSKDSKD